MEQIICDAEELDSNVSLEHWDIGIQASPDTTLYFDGFTFSGERLEIEIGGKTVQEVRYVHTVK